MLYDYEELYAIQKLLFTKIFRYASRKVSITDEFETQVKKYLKIKYVLGLNNGTSALKTALFAVGVKPGDRVLISSLLLLLLPRLSSVLVPSRSPLILISLTV